MTEAASVRIPLASYPGMNRFVLDWLDGRAGAFLPRMTGPITLGERAPRDPALVEALVASNRRWGLSIRKDVERWAGGEAVTLVAGQQVGFAGGPLYTLAKAASLIRMKRDLEARGIPATAFFWLATEDHDFDEVATHSVPAAMTPSGGRNPQLDLVHLSATRGVESRSMVGGLPVPETLIVQLTALFDMDRPPWLREGITFRDSFAELLATVMGNELVLVDALLPELRRAGGKLFASIEAKWDLIQQSIASRSRDLQEAGYSSQVVPPREGDPYTLLFAIGDAANGGKREPIAPPFTDFDPALISTSALTRPLLQDVVLAPDVFLGGPAEVAYYAQIAPLHELLGVRLPRVALRAHALVAPKRIVRLLERFELDPAALFQGSDAMLVAKEPAGVREVEMIAAKARRDLMVQIETIGELALPAEHALARSIQRSVGHIEYHFNKLTERAIRGLVRKDRDRNAAAKELVATLFPDRHVQDRIVGWFAYWRQFDQYLIARLIDEVEPDSALFKIISL